MNHHRTTRTLASVLVGAGLLAFAGAPPASAAGPDWLRWNGKTVNGLKLAPAPVVLDAVAGSPAVKVQFIVGGTVLGEDTTVVPEGDHWVASAPVDLSAYSGRTTVRARYVTAQGGARNVDKVITLVTPAVKAPVAPAPTTVARAIAGPIQVGVPAGTVLTASKGLVIRTPGAVVDGLDITGCVVVHASDVTIRNSRIRCGSGLAVQVASGAKNLVLEDTEIDGLGTAEVGIGWTDYTLRRVNVHDVGDGARFGHRVLIEDSWIHDMSRIGSLHADAIQTTSASDTIIRRNVLDATDTASGDLNNAALMMGSETGTRKVVNVLVEDNVMGGGNYSLNIRGDITASGIVIRNNTFAGGARYGAAQVPVHVPLGLGNVVAATGLPVVANLAR